MHNNNINNNFIHSYFLPKTKIPYTFALKTFAYTALFIMVFISYPILALTLEQALKQANTSFDIDKQHLIIKQARLTLQKIHQNYNYQAELTSQLGLRESFKQQKSDSYIYLYLDKTLFDNYQQADLTLSKTNLTITNKQLEYFKILHRLTIMSVFFDGVLADLEYDYLTQVLALSAVMRNHAEEDFNIGYISEVELLGKKTQVQLDLAKRLGVQTKQILARNQLANLLNMPYPDRPDELNYSKLNKYLNYNIEHEDQWHKLVNKNNTTLNNLQKEINALKDKKQHYENTWQITLSGYVRLGEQTYNKDKEGNYRTGLNLNIPLNNIKRQQDIDTIELDIQQKEIALLQQQEKLNEDVLSLFLKFKTLKQRYNALKQERDYLQFNLDKASLEYEMRLARNIGNAMVLVTKNDLELAKTVFELVLVIEGVNLLARGRIL